jgi:GWxTD domain-containing protein
MTHPRYQLSLVLAAVVGLLGAPGASAADASAGLDVFDGPAGFLLTRSEQAALRGLTGDDQAQRFVELFWARRDPDLTTWRNEFRREFDLRVAMADQMFGHGSTRGAMSDRGRVLILLGPFDTQYDRPRGTETGDSRFTRDDDSTLRFTERPAVELWTYQLARFPGEREDAEAMAIFVETQAGQENFVLDREHRRNATVIRLLGDAPEWYVAHPDLEEPPDVGLVRASRTASLAELAWLDGRPPEVEGLEHVIETGIVADHDQWVWAHLQLGLDGPAASRIVGRVVGPDGTSFGSFSAAAEATTTASHRMYAAAITVDPGQWTVELALANDDGPVAVVREPVEVPPLPPSGTVISPLYWGVEGQVPPEAYLGDAYRIGDWQLQPRPSGVLTIGESLTFACSVIRPEVADESEPQVVTAMTLTKNGQTFYRGTPRPASLAQVTPQVWMFGGRLDTGRLPGPGSYTLQMEATQPSDGTRRVMRFEFTLSPG